jgi:hypothetical protein
MMNKYFQFAGRFFDGLAVASENGYAGYINTKGNFVIKPEFEYALPFHDGIAKVWKEGKPYLIDKKGKILFEHNYHFIKYAIKDSFEPIFIVTTSHSRRYGVIDKTGKLLVDTIYGYIRPFSEELAVADNENEEGVIDLKGDTIVPFGKYSKIGDYNSARAFVLSKEWQSDYWRDCTIGFIDTKGDLVFKKENCKYIDEPPLFSDGIILLHNADEYQYNLYDVKGNAIYQGSNATSIDYAYPLKYGYAVICDTALVYKEHKYIRNIIDKRGNLIFRDADNIFKDAKGNLFFVKGHMIKDKYGKTVEKENVFVEFPENYEFPNYLINKDLVVIKNVRGRYSEWTAINTNRYKEKQDFDDGDDENDVEFNLEDVDERDEGVDFSYIDPEGFKAGLLYVRFNEEGGLFDKFWGYINEKGEIVYRNHNKEYFEKGIKLNINYQEDGGIFYNTDNKELNQEINPNKITLLLDSSVYEKTFEQYMKYPKRLCRRFQIINETQDTLYIQDYIYEQFSVQAKDRNGVWRDIQYYVPSDVISDSIYKLEPNKFWEFAVQSYSGGFKTKMRVAAKIRAVYKYNWRNYAAEPRKLSEDKEFISNEIDCEINASQFVRGEFAKDRNEGYPFEDYIFDRFITIP